jgi:hypothetical protein
MNMKMTAEARVLLRILMCSILEISLKRNFKLVSYYEEQYEAFEL